MGVGERVSDLVGEPVLGTGRGIAKGAIIGAIGIIVVPAAIIGAGFAFGGAAIGWGALALLGAVAVGSIMAVGAGGGAAVGGIAGLLTGAFKGIKSFFSGRDTQVKQNDQQLQAMREQVEAMEQQARVAQMESQMRQMDRARSVESVANPDAPANNASKLEIRQNAQAAAPQAPAV